MDFSTMPEKIGRNGVFAPGYSSNIRESMDFSAMHEKIGKNDALLLAILLSSGSPWIS
jgi:hypothetical protein